MPAVPSQAEPEPGLCEEAQRVLEHRFKQAKAAGFSRLNAELFAHSDADVGVLRHLVELGCPLLEMTRILL